MTDDLEGVLRIIGERGERNALLAPYTTFRVGGPADVVVHPKSVSEIVDLVRDLEGIDVAFLAIGQGSNVLISDGGFRGIVIVLDGDFAQWKHEGLFVEAGAAVKMPVLARQTAQLGLRGLEWMVGVPGSVGGAVCMNAGGHGSDVAENLVSAAVLNLRDATLSSRDVETLELSYRHSAVKAHELVLSAKFQCVAGDRSSAEAELSSIVRWRREHQPGGANCGSVFTNPPGDSAGRLIDAAGLRGFAIGTAHVSTKHANFIQAADNAKSEDIWELIVDVRRRVFERFGVVLKPEVRTVGFDGSLEPLVVDQQLPTPGTPEQPEAEVADVSTKETI